MVKKHPLRKLIKKFQRKATIFRNHATFQRTTPHLFLNPNLADACDALSELCEQLVEVAQKEDEQRSSIRSEAK